MLRLQACTHTIAFEMESARRREMHKGVSVIQPRPSPPFSLPLAVNKTRRMPEQPSARAAQHACTVGMQRTRRLCSA